MAVVFRALISFCEFCEGSGIPGAGRGIQSPELELQAIVSLPHVGAENQTRASLQEQPVP